MTVPEYILLAVIVFGSAMLGAVLAFRILILHLQLISERQQVPCPLLEAPEDEEER